MPDTDTNQPDPIESNDTPDPQPDQTPQTPDPQQGQQTQQPVQASAQQPTQTQQPTQGQQPQQPQTVSNAAPANPSQQPSDSTDPAIRHASRFYRFASALAGGPRTRTVIDPATGVATRQTIPLSRGDIGMAIALEALSGGITGLAQSGPGATGRAAAAGFQTVMQQQQQARQAQEQQAQADFQNQYQTLARKASIYETNSRAALNVATASQIGASEIDKLAEINRQSGVLDVDPATLDNSGQPMTSSEIVDAMKAGKLNVTDQIGPVAGRVETTNPDGSTRWEATHLVIKDPNQKVPLTQDMWDRYTAAGVKGFPPTKIGDGVMIPLRMLQNANEQYASHVLANGRLADLKDTLQGTPFAEKVPTSIDFTQPSVDSAMLAYQRYTSHNASNLEDPYLALQAMGADKRDPKTGTMQPNPDAKFVSTIADQLGGWSVLQAAHNQIVNSKALAEKFSVIDSTDKAEAILAAPKRFSADQVSAAQNFVRIAQSQSIGKAVAEARAKAQSEGTDVQAMWRFGRNPVSGEQLNLGNAPDGALVTPGGQVIPQDLVSTWKPTSAERTVADSARTALQLSNEIATAVARNPALVGPLMGRDKKAMAKLGLGDAQAQQLIDNVSLLQSAVTKMHVGGRFSTEVLKKSTDLANTSMNPDQLSGALAAINGVAKQYADEDRLTTVADYRNRQQSAQQPSGNTSPASSSPKTSQPQQSTNPTASQQMVQTPFGTRPFPAGAVAGRDSQGRIVGYKLASGQIVRYQ